MRHVTIRNVPPPVAEALDRERRQRAKSLNQTVIELLGERLGVGGKPRSNGLRRLAGNWSAEEHREFEAAVAALEQVDEELWR